MWGRVKSKMHKGQLLILSIILLLIGVLVFGYVNGGEHTQSRVEIAVEPPAKSAIGSGASESVSEGGSE